MNKYVLHPDFLKIQQGVYAPAGLTISNVQVEPESKEYGALTCTINHKQVQFRVAKITPTKVGQFVTFWKRLPTGPIAPFDASDHIDFFVIAVSAGKHFGQFVFPQSILLKHDILSEGGKGGKRAIRVYAPWDKAENKQAITTQQWQQHYFMEINDDVFSIEKIKKLFA